MPSCDNQSAFNATVYDANIEKVLPYYTIMQDEVIDLVRMLQPAPPHWLDTGCGTGRLLHKAVQTFPDTRFTAADPSTNMLDMARTRLASFSDRVDFCNDGTGIELAENLKAPPQVVTAMFCHHYSPPAAREKLTEEVFKLLAPGGLYITFENIRPMTAVTRNLALKRWENFQRSQGRDEAAVEQHLARYGRELLPITINEHLRVLQQAGFQTVDLLWASRIQAGFYAIKD